MSVVDPHNQAYSCRAGVKRHPCALDYFATTWAGVNAPYLRAGSTSPSGSEGDCCL